MLEEITPLNTFRNLFVVRKIKMILSPDGLRSPRVQKLRPARHRNAETCHEVLKELGTKDDLLEVVWSWKTSR